MTFEHVGDAFLLYEQRSWLVPGDEPSHVERGFLRPGGRGRAELTLAHPLGLVEVAEGPIEDTSIELTSTMIGHTSTGSAVTELRRRYTVDGDLLRYELLMGMREVPLAPHLRGELRRVTG
ncbi:MAG: FABP family protein, partial [Candidatus Velamenicoccus archaeovorus]